MWKRLSSRWLRISRNVSLILAVVLLLVVNNRALLRLMWVRVVLGWVVWGRIAVRGGIVVLVLLHLFLPLLAVVVSLSPGCFLGIRLVFLLAFSINAVLSGRNGRRSWRLLLSIKTY